MIRLHTTDPPHPSKLLEMEQVQHDLEYKNTKSDLK